MLILPAELFYLYESAIIGR